MSDGQALIYGAYGYTGRLIVARAVREGDRPIVAGRREGPTRELAERHDLPWRAFDLDDPHRLARELDGVALVLHCAGPFSQTSAPMVAGCLAAGAHYLDITGEVDVFEAVLARGAEAERADVVLMPGVGFDVVPTDCLAALLAERLPDAVSLELAFAQRGGRMSPGTTKTVIEGLPGRGRVRRDGQLITVPAAHKVREVPFPGGRQTAVSIPWGDVSTAFHTTGIPNITVYTGTSRAAVPLMRAADLARGLLGLRSVQRLLSGWVERRVQGPTDAQAARTRTEVWGEVRDASGRSVSGTLIVPEGYRFTAEAALACAERVLAGEVRAGAWTPAKALGGELVTTLSGVELTLPERVER